MSMRAMCAITALAMLASAILFAIASALPAEVDDGELLFAARPGEIDSIQYESASMSATITPKQDTLGRYLEARTRRDPNPANPDDVVRHETFKVDAESEERILSSLSRLMTPRQVSWRALSMEEREQLGFLGAKERVTLTKKGRAPRVFLLGQEGFGHRRVYARDTQSDSLVMLDPDVIRALRFADTALRQRALWPRREDQITRVTLFDQVTTRRVEQLVRDDPELTYWSFEGRSGQTRRARQFMKMASKLKIARFVDIDLKGHEPALEMEIELEGGEARALSFYIASFEAISDQLPRGEAKPPESGRVYLVASPWLRGVATLYEQPARDFLDALPRAMRAFEEEEMLAPPKREAHTH